MIWSTLKPLEGPCNFYSGKVSFVMIKIFPLQVCIINVKKLEIETRVV